MGKNPENGVAGPPLLDLMPNKRDWIVMMDEAKAHGSSEEKKLELRLGPPGTDDWCNLKQDMNNKRRDDALLPLGHFPSLASTQIATNNGGQQAHKFGSSEALASPWPGTSCKESCQKRQEQEQMKPPKSYYQFPTASCPSKNLPFMPKEASQPSCNNKGLSLQDSGIKKAFSQASASASAADTAVPGVSQKRTAPGPVVGWPPIRSFRKNITSHSSTKPSPEPQNETPNKVSREDKSVDTCCEKKGMFVKINMDGVPIGRKVDLKAYDSYEKLSSAVDELFRGLLAAQKDSSSGGINNSREEGKPITGVLGGRGEYTLVYEDHEGDRMLVGDVPWHMFVSTVKRLRVLKSSEASALCLGVKHDKKRLEMKN